MTKWTCDTCPFETTDPYACEGHEAGPSTGRGWFGQHEPHRMSVALEADSDYEARLVAEGDAIAESWYDEHGG